MYKILIVDNEKSIRTGLTVGIDWNRMDCQVIGTAENGIDALQKIENEPPDIVLSDINMDEMDGLSLCRVLETRFPTIKCILITGFYEFDNAYNAIKLSNVINLVLKPTSVFKVTEAIQQAISSIQNEKDHLALQQEMSHQLQRNRELSQSITLTNLMGGHITAVDIARTLQAENICLEHYAVIVIYLSRIGSDSENDEAGLDAEQTVCKYVNRVFTGAQYYLIYRHQQCIRIVINSADESEDLVRRCIELSNVVDGCTDFYISVGISRWHDAPAELPAASIEAENAAKFTQYSDDHPVVQYSTLPQLSVQHTEQAKQHLDQIISNISRLDLEAAINSLEALFQYCQNSKAPFHDILRLFLMVTNACAQQYYLYSGQMISEQHDYRARLEHCTSPSELYHMVSGIVQRTIDGLRSRHPANGDIVDNVDSYIQKNYASELSLEGIASVFSMSAGYLGRMFKNKKGINITVYIQNIRIENAKKLIETTNLHTYEIAQAVGISDPVYFSKLFKKVTGCRVRDYREQLKDTEGGTS